MTLAGAKLPKTQGKTGFYQTRLANVYRGSGMFLRGGSVRQPTARMRRRRGKGLQLSGGGLQLSGGGFKRGGNFFDAFLAPARWLMDGVKTSNYAKGLRAKRQAKSQALADDRAAHHKMLDARMTAFRDNLAAKRAARTRGQGMSFRGGGLRLRGGGLVRGSGKGQRIQRRARVI